MQRSFLKKYQSLNATEGGEEGILVKSNVDEY